MAAGTGPLRIFVSYRRADSAGHAGRLQDALNREYGKDHVFYDVTDIEGGIDFAAAITEAINSADVVAVIMGPRWNQRRLRDRILPRPDWVLYEVAQARGAGKPVLPILVGGATMPASLPPSARFLSTINAFAIRDESWDSDSERLFARLRAMAGTVAAPGPQLPVPKPVGRLGLLSTLVAIALTAVAVATWWALSGTPETGPTNIGSVPGGDAGSMPVSSATSSVPGVDRSPASPAPAGASPAPASRTARNNRPPTTGTIEVDQFNATGLMSATRFAMNAKGIADPDGDTLRYRWDFGDGSASPLSSPTVTKVYDRVSRFEVKLFVTDAKPDDEILAAQTYVTVRDITGTWLLTLRPDPAARFLVPTNYQVTLNQQGNQLTGRITPQGGRATVLSGSVEHPTRVHFGSEHAWWNDDEDGYFDLSVSDGNLMIQMVNFQKGRCGPQIPCLGALMNKQ